jgi:putative intracellular protease/amidase
MARYRLFTIVLVLFIFITGCSKGKTSTPTEVVKDKILLLIRTDGSSDPDYMLKNEVLVMIDTLEKAGYDVLVASSDGKPIVTRNNSLTPDLKFADDKVDDYAGLILPCMAISFDRPEDVEANRIVQEAAALGMPIAAQLGGVITLSDAGVLNGKKYTFVEAGLVPDGKYAGQGVVQDGNIITSGMCPYMNLMGMGADGTPKLIQNFVDALAAAP